MAGYILKDASGNPLPVAGEGTTSQSGAAYTYSPGDGNVVICTNTASQVITLPTAASAVNKTVYFCDGNNGWGDNPTVIVPNGSETIGGGSEVVCFIKNGLCGLTSDGTNWFVSAGDFKPFFNSGSIDFDGVNDYVYAADNDNFDLTGELSISAWYYCIDSDQSNYNSICAHRSDPTPYCNYQLYLFTGTGYISFYSRQNGTTNYNEIISTTAPTTSAWHHVVVTIDASKNIAIYHDGSSVHTATMTYDLGVTAGNRLAMGRPGASNGGGTSEFFDGKISQCTIWNKELTSSEVTTLYNSGSPVDPRRLHYNKIKGCFLNSDGFEDSSGSVVYNEAKFYNEAVLTNGAAFSTDNP